MDGILSPGLNAELVSFMITSHGFEKGQQFDDIRRDILPLYSMHIRLFRQWGIVCFELSLFGT
jgi:hypothetical protein